MDRDQVLQALLDQSCLKASWCVNAEDESGEPARVWAESETHAKNLAKLLTDTYGFTVHSMEEI